MVRNSQRKNYDVFLFASISTIRTFHDSTMLHKLEYALLEFRCAELLALRAEPRIMLHILLASSTCTRL